MANKRIYQLTNSTASALTDNDLFVVDKYISAGNYTTVYKNIGNIRSYITALPTSSFTNINTSIINVTNSIVPLYRADIGINERVLINVTGITTGSSTVVTIPDIVQQYADTTRIINIKIIATTSHSPNPFTTTQEYNLTALNSSIVGGNANANKLFQHDNSSGNIVVNPTSILMSGTNLTFTVSHSYAGFTLKVKALALAY